MGGPPLRVGVVGARRKRQGIGHHLARFAAEAGAQVVGIVGTSPETVAEAGADLARHGIAARPYLEVEALLRGEALDVLIVASPHDAHDEALRAALARRVHVLCEKPLCWGGEAAARAKDYAEAFPAAGLHLGVNAQWPFTLPTWRALHPHALDAAPRRFRMRLSPNSRGAAMIPDAVPHALSLLQAVLPHAHAGVASPRVRVLAPDASHLEVAFVYASPSARVDATLEMRQATVQPREAGYGFDDAYASRCVEMDGYRLFLEDGGRRLPLPDPTPLLVRAFLDRVSSSAAPTADPAAWPGMAFLEAIDAAWTHAGHAGEQGRPSTR